MDRRLVLALAILWCGAMRIGAQPTEFDKLKEKPIANVGGKVGELLRQWWKEGSAAGNAGDFYDNRDGDHSPLNLTPYPQLSLFKYSEQDFKLKKNWAAAREIRPHVTFGNSSTSAPAHLGGSNPRSYYVSSIGMGVLYQQYRKNNLYIYPEHRDHDPGHNGVAPPSPSGRGAGGEGGYGDLYPTNTPYLIVSQGSSGSDQPFMRMMPSVLAAFRPEVKAQLIETGTLMPTIQMLFRSTNKHLKDPKEYLTGKAHPSVFEGSWVDELALVQKAHALTLDALPPMVQLRVLEDDKAIPGIDYVDATPSQVLAYTPACIARIHRSKAYQQRLVVDAGASFDVNKSKLTYTWVILRGDPSKIKIVPKKDDASVAEITVAYHERRPIAPGSDLESNRVDIGVFVHNGTHYSAPGFVTFHTLDRESRTYNERGVILDIAHGMSETTLRGANWDKLLAHVANDPLAGKLLDASVTQKGIFAHLAEIYEKRRKAFENVQAEVKEAESARGKAKEPAEVEKATKALAAVRQRLVAAQKAMDDLLDQGIESIDGSLRQFVESRLTKLAREPLFTHHHKDWLKEKRTPAVEARVTRHWQKPIRLGIATPDETLTPLLPGKTLADAKWTKFELAQLEALHASLLAELAFPGMLQVTERVNYVDHRLSLPREWRDVFRHDAKGEYIGWRRYSSDGIQDFNHDGLLVVEKDERGRCVKGRVVRYEQPPSKEKGLNTNLLRTVPTETIVTYEFAGAEDTRGRRLDQVKDEKK